jgi:hypothetical protein
MTVWDTWAFHYFGPAGLASYRRLDKATLARWSTLRLQFCVDELRSWTICCEGQQPPEQLLDSIMMCAKLATRKQRFMRLQPNSEGGTGGAGVGLPWKAHLRVLRFLFNGGPKLWAAVVEAEAADGAAEEDGGLSTKHS